MTPTPVPPVVAEGDLLWTPGPERVEAANLTRFTRWLDGRAWPAFRRTIAALWRWSVSDLDGFWQAIWDYFGITASAPPAAGAGPPRDARRRSGSPGARLNYAENVLRCEGRGGVALLHGGESVAAERAVVAGARRAGAGGWRPGCARPACGPATGSPACLPNIPQAVVAMLATTAIGAVWAACSPDFGDPRRPRPVRAARAHGAVRGRRLPLRRHGRTTGGTSGARWSPGCRRCGRWSTSPCSAWAGRPPAGPLCTGWDERAGPSAGAADFRFEQVRVRPSAVGAVLLGDDRPAQADRARPRRHPAGAAEAADLPHRPAPGRPVCSSTPPPAG